MNADPVINVVDNEDASRFEIQVDGQTVGFAEYRRTPEVVVYSHTEIADGVEGMGLGSVLAKAVLDDALNRHLAVKPMCPFIASWIKRHPEYLDVLVPSYTEYVESMP